MRAHTHKHTQTHKKVKDYHGSHALDACAPSSLDPKPQKDGRARSRGEGRGRAGGDGGGQKVASAEGLAELREQRASPPFSRPSSQDDEGGRGGWRLDRDASCQKHTQSDDCPHKREKHRKKCSVVVWSRVGCV